MSEWDQFEAVDTAVPDPWGEFPEPNERQVQMGIQKEVALRYARKSLLESNFPSTKAALLGLGSTVASMVNRVTGDDLDADSYNVIGDAINQAASEQDAERTMPAIVHRGYRGAVQTLPLTVAASSAALSAGATAGVATAAGIGMGAAQEMNQSTTQGRQAGLTGGKLASYTITRGVIEGGTEAVLAKFGLGGLEQYLGGAKNIAAKGLSEGLRKAGIATLQEVPQEIVTEIGHNVAEKLYGVDNADLLPQLPQIIADTTVQTLMTMGAAAGPVMASKALGTAAPPTQAAPGKPEVLKEAIAPEDVQAWSAQPENAAAVEELKKQEKPSRAQWEAAGLPPATAEVRQAFVKEMQNEVQGQDDAVQDEGQVDDEEGVKVPVADEEAQKEDEVRVDVEIRPGVFKTYDQSNIPPDATHVSETRVRGEQPYWEYRLGHETAEAFWEGTTGEARRAWLGDDIKGIGNLAWSDLTDDQKDIVMQEYGIGRPKQPDPKLTTTKKKLALPAPSVSTAQKEDEVRVGEPEAEPASSDRLFQDIDDAQVQELADYFQVKGETRSERIKAILENPKAKAFVETYSQEEEETPAPVPVEEAKAVPPPVEPAKVGRKETTKKPKAEAPAGVQEPWQMTAFDYATQHSRRLTELEGTKPRPLKKLYGTKGPTEQQAAEHAQAMKAWNSEHRAASKAHKAYLADQGSHKRLVEEAVKAGKPVPAEVLADYPELSAKKPPEGQTQLQRKQASRRQVQQITKDLDTAFVAKPGSVKVEETEDGWDVTLPGGRTTEIIRVDSGIVVNAKIAAEAYGTTEAEIQKILDSGGGAAAVTVPAGLGVRLKDRTVRTFSEVTMLIDPRLANSTTAKHDALHLAEEWGFFDTKTGKRIRTSLLKKHGSIEAIAEARGVWEGPTGLWAKLRAFFQEVLEPLRRLSGLEMKPDVAMRKSFGKKFWSQPTAGKGQGASYQVKPAEDLGPYPTKNKATQWAKLNPGFTVEKRSDGWYAVAPTQEANWQDDVLLEAENAVDTSTEVTLPDLFQRLKAKHPDLTVDEFRKGMLELRDQGAVRLSEYTRAPADVAGEEAVIRTPPSKVSVYGETLYYVRRGGGDVSYQIKPGEQGLDALVRAHKYDEALQLIDAHSKDSMAKFAAWIKEELGFRLMGNKAEQVKQAKDFVKRLQVTKLQADIIRDLPDVSYQIKPKRNLYDAFLEYKRKEQEAAQQQPETTGTKHAKTDELREKIGMPPRPKVVKEKATEWEEEAARRIAADPDYVPDLVERMLAKPFGPDKIENAALGQHIQALQNRRHAGEDVLEELANTVLASTLGGTEAGRDLASRKGERYADFSLAGLIDTHIDMVGEKPSKEMLAKLEEMADRIAKQDAELSELRTRKTNEEIDRLIEEAIQAAEKQKPAPEKKGTKRERLKRQASEAVVSFQSAWEEALQATGGIFTSGGLNPEAIGALGRAAKAAAGVVKAYAELGVNSFLEFSASVKRDIGELTEQQSKIFREEWDKAFTNAESPLGENPTPAMIGDSAQDLARWAVKSGIRERENVVQAVHDQLTRWGVKQSIDNTAEAIAGYFAQQESKENARYLKSLGKRLTFWDKRKTDAKLGVLPTPKPKKTRTDKQILDKLIEVDKTKREALAEIEAEKRRRWNLGQKLYAGLYEGTSALPRELMAGLENSVVLRQGWFFTMQAPLHPIIVFSRIVDGLQSMFSNRMAVASRENLRQRANYSEYELAGIADNPLNKMDELYQSRLVDWLANTENILWFPARFGAKGYIATARGFRAFSNGMKADVYDILKKDTTNIRRFFNKHGMAKVPEWTESDTKLTGRSANIFGGRGTGLREGGLENWVLWAPKWVWSRIQAEFLLPLQMATPSFIGQWNADPAIRLAHAKFYAQAVVGAATHLAALYWTLALLADDDDDKPTIEWDTTSTDLWKLRMGDTRIDVMGGMQQYLVFVSRLWHGTKKTQSGEIVPIRGEGSNPYKGDAFKEMANQLRYKLGPAASGIVDFITQKTAVGEELPDNVLLRAGSIIGRRLVPMTWPDIFKAEKSLGMKQGTVAAIEAFMGASVSTYGDKTKYREGSPEERKEQFTKDLEKMKWDSPAPAYSEMLTPDQVKQVEQRKQEVQGKMIYGALSDAPDRTKTVYKSDKTFQQAVKEHQKAVAAFQTLRQTMSLDKALEALEAGYPEGIYKTKDGKVSKVSHKDEFKEKKKELRKRYR